VQPQEKYHFFLLSVKLDVFGTITITVQWFHCY